MTTEASELDALDSTEETPVEGVLTLSTGREVRIERLRTRQLLRLIKVFTRGAAPLLGEIDWSSSNTDKFVGQLLGTLVLAIPEAEDETIDFVIGLATPNSIPESFRGLSKEERLAHEQTRLDYFIEMGNDPEIADTIAILTNVITREAPYLMTLGNQLAALLPTALKAEEAAQPKKSAPQKKRTSASKSA